MWEEDFSSCQPLQLLGLWSIIRLVDTVQAVKSHLYQCELRRQSSSSWEAWGPGRPHTHAIYHTNRQHHIIDINLGNFITVHKDCLQTDCRIYSHRVNYEYCMYLVDTVLLNTFSCNAMTIAFNINMQCVVIHHFTGPFYSTPKISRSLWHVK